MDAGKGPANTSSRSAKEGKRAYGASAANLGHTTSIETSYSQAKNADLNKHMVVEGARRD